MVCCCILMVVNVSTNYSCRLTDKGVERCCCSGCRNETLKSLNLMDPEGSGLVCRVVFPEIFRLIEALCRHCIAIGGAIDQTLDVISSEVIDLMDWIKVLHKEVQ